MIRDVIIGGAIGGGIGAFGYEMFTADRLVVAVLYSVLTLICIAAYFAHITRRSA